MFFIFGIAFALLKASKPMNPSERTTHLKNLEQIETLTTAYKGGAFNRREFLFKLASITGSMAAAHLFIEQKGLAQVISDKETKNTANGVNGADVAWVNGDVMVRGYLCTPKTEEPSPAVLVIHENRGLNEHTRDVARRFAAQGFVALAPDILSRRGGTHTMKTPDEARTAIGTISAEDALSDLEAGLEYLDTLRAVRKGQLASVGFCWGGARSWGLATQSPRLKAAVVFYGSAPPTDQLVNVKCPVLGLYGETDERITSLVPQVASAMKAESKPFDHKIYQGAGHAFFNDTGERYNAPAATDAWTRTVTFLQTHLK
jgi:carboxymethylenebutenolidase